MPFPVGFRWDRNNESLELSIGGKPVKGSGPLISFASLIMENVVIGKVGEKSSLIVEVNESFATIDSEVFKSIGKNRTQTSQTEKRDVWLKLLGNTLEKYSDVIKGVTNNEDLTPFTSYKQFVAAFSDAYTAINDINQRFAQTALYDPLGMKIIEEMATVRSKLMEARNFVNTELRKYRVLKDKLESIEAKACKKQELDEIIASMKGREYSAENERVALAKASIPALEGKRGAMANEMVKEQQKLDKLFGVLANAASKFDYLMEGKNSGTFCDWLQNKQKILENEELFSERVGLMIKKVESGMVKLRDKKERERVLNALSQLSDEAELKQIFSEIRTAYALSSAVNDIDLEIGKSKELINSNITTVTRKDEEIQRLQGESNGLTSFIEDGKADVIQYVKSVYGVDIVFQGLDIKTLKDVIR
ncbi:MAG: hypothetical protein KGH49_03875 [Candidatus Micrarchaeota archaeon]|nr:hypothetical protein [Candidatus Micrarchaeota archaeon]